MSRALFLKPEIKQKSKPEIFGSPACFLVRICR